MRRQRRQTLPSTGLLACIRTKTLGASKGREPADAVVSMRIAGARRDRVSIIVRAMRSVPHPPGLMLPRRQPIDKPGAMTSLPRPDQTQSCRYPVCLCVVTLLILPALGQFSALFGGDDCSRRFASSSRRNVISGRYLPLERGRSPVAVINVGMATRSSTPILSRRDDHQMSHTLSARPSMSFVMRHPERRPGKTRAGARRD